MAITMLCHVDNVSYKEKPKNQAGAVQNRFKTSDFMSIDIGKVIKALESGQTIALANCEDRKKDKFKAANSAALDFDNGHSSEFEKSDPAGRAAIVKAAIENGKIISKQEVIDRCREKGFAAPTFIYSTFSAGQYIQDCLALAEQGLITAEELDRIQATSTFRAVWVFNHTVNDPALYTDVCEKRLRGIFPESDPDFKIHGILFGTKYSDTIRTDEIVDITTIPYPPQEQESSDPEQITVDTITASADPPPQQGFRTDLSAANTRSYSAMSQSDSQRRNILTYLKFIPPSTLTFDEWITVCNAMYHEGFNYSEFDEWSRSDGDPRYNEAENLKHWESRKTAILNGGAIQKIAKNHGMTAEAFRAKLAELYPPKSMKPKHTTAPAGAAADQSAAPSEDQPQPITLEQIKAYTPEQWSDIIHQHYGVTAETSRVVEKFARLYERCYRGRLLQDNGRLPKYVKPIIKDRRAKELVYTSIVGFEVNPVPLARFLRERYHIINVPATSNAAGLIYIYSNGKYKRVDAEEEKGLIRVLLESIDQSGGIWDVRKIKDTSLLLHSAENVYSLDAFNTNEKIINFKNGLLDLETGTVYPHSIDTLTTVQLPFNYDPNAGTDTPLFDSMIDHFAEGDEEVKTLLLQFCAATISNIDMGVFKCFLIMYGAGDSGKSQLFKLLHKLVGTDNAHTTTLFKLENNNFEPMNLYGKRFTGHAELDNNSTVRHVGMIKALTGGDYIPGEVKCGGVYNFIYHGTVMFCSNDKPHLPSADAAFYNRLRLVYVSKAVEEKDPKFFEKMWEERHKIINKLMPYLREIIKTGEILDPVSSKALKKKYKAENSPAIEFFADCCVMRPAEEFDPTYRKKINDGQTATNVYKDFVNWCLDNGYSSHVIPKKLDFEKDIARYLESEGVISSGTADDIKIKKHGLWYYKFYIKRNVQSDTMPEQSDPTTPTTPSEWDGTPLF